MDSEMHSNLVAIHRENPIVPLFLLKTFSILETADTSIVTWSETGDSFIVLDPDRFASEVIPTHFKHNKFSSFVRQLNFYGFRKVKGKLNFVGRSEQHSWEFRHPYFQQGQPGLLTDIRRSSLPEDSETTEHQPAPVDCDGVDALKKQVAQLTGQVDRLTKSVEDMQKMFAQFTQMAHPATVVVPQSEELTGAVTESSPDKWDIDDDELLMTFLEDLNDGPLSIVPPASSPVLPRPTLKRGRSVDEVSAVLEPASRKFKPESSMLDDPLVVQAVANAIALTTQTAGTTLSFEQYSSALSTILSAVGSAQSQALAIAAAASAATELLIARNQSEARSSMSHMSLAVV